MPLKCKNCGKEFELTEEQVQMGLKTTTFMYPDGTDACLCDECSYKEVERIVTGMKDMEKRYSKLEEE
jgi:DNA-directed RNA polymerase subunit RPC12/RpoP